MAVLPTRVFLVYFIPVIFSRVMALPVITMACNTYPSVRTANESSGTGRRLLNTYVLIPFAARQSAACIGKFICHQTGIVCDCHTFSPVLPVPEYNLPVPVCCLTYCIDIHTVGFPHRLLHVILPFQTPAYDKKRSSISLSSPAIAFSSAFVCSSKYGSLHHFFHIPVCNPLFSYPPDLHSLAIHTLCFAQDFLNSLHL